MRDTADGVPRSRRGIDRTRIRDRRFDVERRTDRHVEDLGRNVDRVIGNVRRVSTGKARLNHAADRTLRDRECLRLGPDDLVRGAVDRARLPPPRTCIRQIVFSQPLLQIVLAVKGIYVSPRIGIRMNENATMK